MASWEKETTTICTDAAGGFICWGWFEFVGAGRGRNAPNMRISEIPHHRPVGCAVGVLVN